MRYQVKDIDGRPGQCTVCCSRPGIIISTETAPGRAAMSGVGTGQLNIRFFHHSTSIFKWMNVLNITILELVIITQIFTFTYIYSYYSLLNNSHHRYLENRKSIKIYLPSQPLACDHVILKLNITLWRFRIILLGQFGS